jgi:hypothetical protein
MNLIIRIILAILVLIFGMMFFGSQEIIKWVDIHIFRHGDRWEKDEEHHRSN